jgi:hypothetical protein
MFVSFVGPSPVLEESSIADRDFLLVVLASDHITGILPSFNRRDVESFLGKWQQEVLLGEISRGNLSNRER